MEQQEITNAYIVDSLKEIPAFIYNPSLKLNKSFHAKDVEQYIEIAYRAQVGDCSEADYYILKLLYRFGITDLTTIQMYLKHEIVTKPDCPIDNDYLMNVSKHLNMLHKAGFCGYYMFQTNVNSASEFKGNPFYFLCYTGWEAVKVHYNMPDKSIFKSDALFFNYVDVMKRVAAKRVALSFSLWFKDSSFYAERIVHLDSNKKYDHTRETIISEVEININEQKHHIFIEPVYFVYPEAIKSNEDYIADLREHLDYVRQVVDHNRDYIGEPSYLLIVIENYEGLKKLHELLDETPYLINEFYSKYCFITSEHVVWHDLQGNVNEALLQPKLSNIGWGFSKKNMFPS